ncbi:hypothetical protein DESC_820009 [Desulfosarcina cetonica]|nr:hypothetical protein DESC_820009 [Desulfosarcina cetonica]
MWRRASPSASTRSSLSVISIRCGMGTLLTRKQARNIVVEHKNHQQKQNKNAGLLGDLAHARVDRPAGDRLDEEKQQMAAVEHRNGQEIEHGQVDTENGDEEDQVGQPRFGLLPGHLGNHDRSAQGLGGNGALDQLADAQDRQARDLIGLADTFHKGIDDTPLDDDAVARGNRDARGGNADAVTVHLLTEHILFAIQHRHDPDGQALLAAPHPHGERLPLALGNNRLHRVPAVHRTAVDADDQVPFFKAGFLGRIAVGHLAHQGFQGWQPRKAGIVIGGVVTQDVLGHFGLGRNRDIVQGALAPGGDVHRCPLVGGDQAVDVAPGGHGLAVNGDDFVAGANTSLGRRTFGDHLVDHRPDVLGADEEEKSEVDDHGQKQVEAWPGGHDQDALENMFVGERKGNQVRINLNVRLIAHHLDIAAQRNGGNPVVGDSNGFPEYAGTKPQGEFFDAHTKKPSHQEMTQFMEKNQNAENDDKGKNAGGHRRNLKTPVGGSGRGPSPEPSDPPR